MPLAKALEVWGHGESIAICVLNPLKGSRLGFMPLHRGEVARHLDILERL